MKDKFEPSKFNTLCTILGITIILGLLYGAILGWIGVIIALPLAIIIYYF